VRKIKTLFVRDFTGPGKPYLTGMVTPGCEWVLEGIHSATRKYDGTCVRYEQSEWSARREVKQGKTPPPGWVEEDFDEITGHRVGWEPADQSGFRKFLVEAIMAGVNEPPWTPGTYELIGPKINGNPERATEHRLIRHTDAEVLAVDTRSFKTLEIDLTALMRDGIEGVVWHHKDGRMSKLKGIDFK
jgi:hypothetical protein